MLVSSDQASFPPIIASMESFSRAWSWVPRAVANGFVTFVHFWELLGVLSNGFLIFRQIDLVLAEEETGVMVKWFFSCGFWEQEGVYNGRVLGFREIKVVRDVQIGVMMKDFDYYTFAWSAA